MKRTITIHGEYADSGDPPIPGEALGDSTQYQRMTEGDIVTAVGHLSAYYFDPEMRIEGTHYQWSLDRHYHGFGPPKLNWVRVFPDKFVQVNYAPEESGIFGPLYTYRDPSRTLQIGDLVEVPVTYGTKVGEVVGFGKNYDGPIKDVVARVRREEL